MTRLDELLALLVRLGLGAALLWRGLDPYLAPSTAQLGSPATLALGPAWSMLGLLLLTGVLTRPSATLAAGLLAIAILDGGVAGLGDIKDVGLLGGAVSLALTGSRLFSVDAGLALVLPHYVLAARPSRRALQYSHLALRFGLALTLVVSGLDKSAFTSGTERYVSAVVATGGVPHWPVVGGSSPTLLVLWMGMGELLLGAALLLGLLTHGAAAIAAALLLLYVGRVGLVDALMARDVALLAVALALTARGGGYGTMDTYVRRMQERVRLRESGLSTADAEPAVSITRSRNGTDAS